MRALPSGVKQSGYISVHSPPPNAKTALKSTFILNIFQYGEYITQKEK